MLPTPGWQCPGRWGLGLWGARVTGGSWRAGTGEQGGCQRVLVPPSPPAMAVSPRRGPVRQDGGVTAVGMGTGEHPPTAGLTSSPREASG